MKEHSKGLRIEVTMSDGTRHLISPLRDRTTKDLTDAIKGAGADGACLLTGGDGNFVALLLNNLSVVEGEEITMPD